MTPNARLRRNRALPALLRLTALLGAIAPAPDLTAALPPVYQQREEALRRSVLSPVQRPAQKRLEQAEDLAINTGRAVLHLFDDIALQTTFNEGADLSLRGQLTEDFFKSASNFETDVLFYREALDRLHLRLRGTDIIAKRVVSGRPSYYKAGSVTVSVGRTIRNLTETERANGEPPTVRYRVSAVLERCRVWQNNNWSPMKESEPLGVFELVLYPPLDRRDLILNDGKMKRELVRDWELAPVEGTEFPSLPAGERLPLIPRLARLELEARSSSLTKLAQADDAEAQYLVGWCYQFGRGREANPAEAKSWYERSAAQQFDPAVYRLAEESILAKSPVPGSADTRKRLAESARRGYLPSLALLGYALVNGMERLEGSGDAVNTGMEYLRYAARQGDAVALFGLAERSVNGNDRSISAEQALKHLRQAAGQRLPDAAILLGEMHRAGKLVPKNPVEAWKWYHLATRWSVRPRERSISLRATDALLQLRDNLSEEQIETALAGVQEMEFLSVPREEP